jgi:hypothetical protein
VNLRKLAVSPARSKVLRVRPPKSNHEATA